MARFKIGQKIVCTHSDWVDPDTFNSAPGPMRNEIVTVHGYHGKFQGKVMITLDEYSPEYDSFDESCFQPTSEILEAQPEKY